MQYRPVGGLPISQKLSRDRTIPIILPSGKDILADTIIKITIGYTNLGTRQIQCRLGSKVCLFIALNASMAGYPTKNNVFFGKKNKHFHNTILIKGYSSYIHCKDWRHESESAHFITAFDIPVMQRKEHQIVHPTRCYNPGCRILKLSQRSNIV